MENGRVIEASIDIVVAEDPKPLAALAPALLEDDRARLTYRFTWILATTRAGRSVPSAVYGGDNLERPMPAELRGYIHLLFTLLDHDGDTTSSC